MSEIKTPKLDWVERYRRMLDIAYTTLTTADMILYKKLDPNTASEMVKELHKSFASQCGKKLVEKFNLKSSVEDALKLFKLYSCEVWGYGAEEYVSAKLETQKKGVYANLVCRGWELAKRSKQEEEMKKVCNDGCIVEYTTLLKTLAPNLKLKRTKLIPYGNDRCEYTIEEE